MRGKAENQSALISHISPAERVPKDHPIRRIDGFVREVEHGMARDFNAMYSRYGRPSIPPETLLRALILQILYSIRSERLLCEMIEYNMLFRWFLRMNADDPVFDHSTFSKNRDRLLDQDIAREFLARVTDLARGYDLLSDEHFTVDGTLIQAWASHQSFKRKDGKDDDRPSGDFRGEPRSNETHVSTSDPDARLAKKAPGQEAKLSMMGTAVMDNRNDLPVAARVSVHEDAAERRDCAQMLGQAAQERGRGITAGADKAFDSRAFVEECRENGVTPHVMQRDKGSAIDERTTRHEGYQISVKVRRRIEKIFGWAKTIGGMRQTKLRGWVRNDWQFNLVNAVYCMVRMVNLVPAPSRGTG